ncbi:single-stranded-DNA-specific exonuclease RecJ [Fusibacter sp. 3D3]|uniref:single-stranded-DNA-specific exonuclease RecJ n=1 Tax=Fusibacter sp. 3D3 TaxID=1048380 RepID=UPI0008539ECA|nr:single-stranded-DNA-specific exonuclease RecJ [Fusibacter sp. 3D3]GAU76912.1 single-stranded-DNA-specific exonuclease RecJ [Fusibacter sp. 3D3]
MIFQSSIWHSIDIDDDQIKQYSQIFNTEPLITKLLLDRGMTTAEQVNTFFSPKLEDLHDPFLLKDMDIAVNRIKQAINGKEKIWIYGDYDVDGITSITVMCRYFKYIGIEVSYYIPDRHDEGYGISRKGIELIHETEGTLIITVDSGITAVDEVAYAKTLGIDVIVTDHHECQEVLPDAFAIINPKIEGYPFDMLCGCGVALKLVQALMTDSFMAFIPSVMDVVALGTIADIVPLRDENRIFTKLGLEQMKSSQIPGIRALIKEANLEGKEINAGHIGFIIAPRINASGRIGDPKIAVEMLLTEDHQRAEAIARDLSELNAERQSRERLILEEAIDFIKTHIDLEREKILLVVGESWHTGIIGIVASKLCDRFSRPVVILNVEDGVAKGSARSVDGISIFDVLSQFKNLYEKFGGHEQAAGLTLKAEHVALLKQGLLEYSEAHISFEMLTRKRKADGILKPQMVNHKLIEEIDALKPFGLANPKPQFTFENLTLEDFKCIGKEQAHLKMIVNDGVRVYDALSFNNAHLSRYLRKQDKIHLLLNLEINHFMGVETIQFMVKDVVKPHMPMNDLLELKMVKAVSNFIEAGTPKRDICKFTSESDFDIIFLAPQKKTLFVYSIEGMIRLKDYFFGRNFYAYALHFNELDFKECVQGHIDIVFMPYESTASQIADAVILDENWNLSIHIPSRNDLMHFYKNIGSMAQFELKKMAHQLNLSMPKCLICLDLLEDMRLIQYSEKSGTIMLSILSKPKERIDLEALPLYKKIWEPHREAHEQEAVR